MGRIDLELQNIQDKRSQRNYQLLKQGQKQQELEQSQQSTVNLDDNLQSSNSDSNLPKKEEHNHDNINTPEEGILKPMDLQLYRAAIKGELGNFMRTLLSVSRDKGLSTTAILNQVTPLGNTVLHLAVELGHADLAGHLACDFPHLLLATNRIGDTPFIVAAKSGQHLTVNNIIAYFSKDFPTPNNIFRMANQDGNTALHEALLNKNEDMVNFLLPRDKEVPFLYANTQGKTPIYITIETGQISLVRKMLQLLPHSTGIKIAGNSPINVAIKAMNTDMLVMICENIPSLMYTRDEDGGTPLHCAASVGYYKGVEFLLNRFAEFILKHNNNGLLPIHIASQKGHLNIVKKLLLEFPDSKELVTSTMGENILHIASKFGRIGIVKYILETPYLGVLINQKDDDGNTPLHLATRNCFPKIVSCLTWEKRVKLNLINKDGMTALDIIEEFGIIPPSYKKRLTWIALKAAGGEPSKYPKTLFNKLNQPNNQIIMNDTTTPSSRVDYKDRINTLLLVSTLVATVTFAAGFTMPGGYNNSTPDQGQATMLNKRAFQAFVICDTIAMYSATIVAVTLIWAQLGDLHLVLSSLRLAMPLLGVSLSMMSTAFLAGVWLVISKLGWLSHLILIMGIVFLCILVLLFMPLIMPTNSRNYVMRYISYFFFFQLLLIPSGSNDDQDEEDYYLPAK